MPQAFSAAHPTGVCLDNPRNYRFIPPGRGKPGEVAAAEESFHELNEPDMEPVDNSGGSISALYGSAHHASALGAQLSSQGGGAGSHNGTVLDFLERTALDAQVSSDTIRAITSHVENNSIYPGSQLGNSLKLVARLIGGSLPARIYYVSQGGYDTHTNQINTHERLLKDLGDSVRAFVQDLNRQGNLARVLLMTFSEFGRRVAENANSGTDHGAAAPMFVLGGRVKPGLLGEYPSLAPGDLFLGDLRFKVDFRSVYAAVLDAWLSTPSELVLGRRFSPLPLI